MKKAIIAVDAGGTKTKVCVINAKKEVVYEKSGGPGSPAVLKEAAFHNIFELVEEVYSQVRDQYQISFIQMGVSGLGTVANVSEYEKAIADKIGIETSIESDAILGLYSIVEDKFKEGVLVLSGTGSACAGINNDDTMLLGGFGQLLTETGSSYASVKMLVTKTILHYEDSLTYIPLGKKFMDLINANSIIDFKVFMYNHTKGEIAKYAKFISNEALNGDLEAQAILKKSGQDLAYYVVRLYHHLKLTNKAVLGFRGSFIQNAPFVKEELLKTLELENISLNLVGGDGDPIYGAYYLAKKKGKL